jgi:hypothetical protein
MMPWTDAGPDRLPLPAEVRLPLMVLDRYLFFLSRRRISRSNLHYARRRIHGLRGLDAALAGTDHPAVAQVRQLLRGIQPQNLHALAERLKLTLHPLTRTQLPADLMVTRAPVPASFWARARRILLVAGPAIGIGDEIITFPLPRWIEQASPRAELVLLSGYRDLWQGVGGVHRVHHYDDDRTLVNALRGEHAPSLFDLVLLLDFESPELYQLVCEERAVPQYVELSLGARRCSVVDNERKRLHRLEVPDSYFGNFYAGFDWLARAMGLAPPPDRFPAPPAWTSAADEPLRVYVSPFTSKADPVATYWSRLLAALVPESPGRQMQFVVDPGPNLDTWRFAGELTRAVGAQAAPGTTLEVARPAHGRNLPLPEVGAELRAAHVVICSDSFTAHLAPALGRTTLVLAGRGLEDWRVPAPGSFYFSASTSLEGIAGGMRQLLSHFGVEPLPDYHRPRLDDPERRCLETEREAFRLLASTRGCPDALLDGFRGFLDARAAVVDRLPYWPPRARSLLADVPYASAPRALEREDRDTDALAARYYIEDGLGAWRNTNLRKYLALMIREQGSGAPVGDAVHVPDAV